MFPPPSLNHDLSRQSCHRQGMGVGEGRADRPPAADCRPPDRQQSQAGPSQDQQHPPDDVQPRDVFTRPLQDSRTSMDGDLERLTMVVQARELDTSVESVQGGAVTPLEGASHLSLAHVVTSRPEVEFLQGKHSELVTEPWPAQDGSGTFRVHTLPTRLVAGITTHELVNSWPKLKHEVGRCIWGEERFEPVPTVVDGAVDRYDLGAVLMKTRLTPGEKWRLLPPRCQALGSIYDLIWHTDMPVDAAVEMAAPLRVEEGAPWPNHRFHGLAFKGGYCRQVAVTVSGCHRVQTRAIPNPDSLVLNLYRFSGRYRTDKMYVITEVIYAEELHVIVRVSINKDDVKILHRVPLAFRLNVYDVRDLITLVSGRPYNKTLRVRWMGLADASFPSTYPRRSRGMGDVTKRTSDVTRRLDLFPARNRRGQPQVDYGGDRNEHHWMN